LNELAQYLLENLILDFEGEVTTETVRAFLRKDNSPEARTLLQKVVEDNGIDDLLLAVADCLTQELAETIGPNAIKTHLGNYAES